MNKIPLHPVRPLLLAQILFTLFAFLLMFVITYTFMRDTVHDHLIVSTNSMLNYEQSRIEADLLAPKTATDIFSETVKSMILHEADVEELQAYITEISDFMRLNEAHSLSFGSILCYFEKLPDGPAFLSDLDVDISSQHPTERAWYRNAVAANGAIAETVIENDQIFGETVLAYSTCLLDEKGRRLGVVCFIVRIDVIGKSVIEMTLDMGGYGILLSQDLSILAHPNTSYVGLGIRNPVTGLSDLTDELVETGWINERVMSNWLGEPTIAFFRELDNGWYLGVMIPEADYFRSITDMAWLLGILSAVLAAALIIILIRIDAAKSRADFESRQKSVFLANMSHEIRTPMNAIISMTSIGKAASDLERKDYCLEKVEEASQHLLGVINDILDMSKIEANMLELSEVEYRFEKMLKMVVNVIGFRLVEKQQEFSLHIDENIPKTVIGDDQRLAQVMTNLLGNAIKFTPEGGKISVSAKLLEEENCVCVLQIEVTDTGIGISPEQQARLFKSFQQAESSTTREFGGTGLGLAISKSIVEKLGGKVWVDSKLGEGSTFGFTTIVKRGDCDAFTERELQKAKDEMENISGEFKGRRALLADDVEVNREIVIALLEPTDISIDSVKNGLEAVSRFKEAPDRYDVILMDVQMPELDGYDATIQIRALGTKEAVEVPIIALTANVFREDIEKCLAIGMNDHLGKPIDLDELMEKLRLYL